MTGKALCEPPRAVFVAGAALCEPRSADAHFATGTAALCEPCSAHFVTGTALCEPPRADFVAGAALGEPQSADFVAGAALCEPQSADFVAYTYLYYMPLNITKSQSFHDISECAESLFQNLNQAITGRAH